MKLFLNILNKQKGDVIIYYKTFSQVGEYHKSVGKENEDAIKVVVNGDYFYCVISDGAGSSNFAKEAARCTVNTSADFCYNNGNEFFTDRREETARNLIFDIQQALYEQAKKLNTDLSQMMCTLVLLCVDTKTMQYTTVHVGDGLVAKITDNETEIISYPENGVTKQYTYMVNSPSVLKHMRIKSGIYNPKIQFFACTDGAVENCYTTQDYIKRIHKIDYIDNFEDDSSYCKLVVYDI